jgi:hypothetical protein
MLLASRIHAGDTEKNVSTGMETTHLFAQTTSLDFHVEELD